MANTTYSQDIPLEQDITVDLTESQIEVIYANQYDDGGDDNKHRIVNCHIQDEGIDFDCSDYQIALWMKKSNGKGLSRNINKEDFSKYCSVSGNIVTFPIIKEMTYSYGRQECNLELLQNEKPIYSCSFYIRVNKAPLQQSEILDSDDYKTVHDEYLKLDKKVTEEIERATEAEQVLTDNFEAEVNRAKESEQEIADNLEQEIIDREQADTTLTNALNAEIERAKSAESTLETNLDNEIKRAKEAEKILTDDLIQEVTDRTNAIATEKTARENADNTITNNLNSEISRAKASEKTNADNISAESARATTKENEIATNLSNEVNRATDEESVLTTNLNNEVSRATNAEQTISDNLNTEITRATNAEQTLDSAKADKTSVYTKNEVDNKFSTLETNIDWKESVATYTNIATTYPSPEDGWTVNVKDTDYTYRYNGTSWVAISANAIPKATNSIDGLLSKEDHAKYEDTNNKKHTHDNKNIIDKITQSLLDAWDSAVTHISDTVKHITSGERTNWNTAYDHSQSAHAPSNAQVNVIETVKVNGTALTPSSKAVDITVPSVGNGTITIKQNGTSKGTFTMNQSGNTTIELNDNNTWRGIQDNLTSTSTTDSLSANQGRLLANGNARDNTKLPLAGGTMTGLLIANSGIKVSGRVNGSGDDEGIVVTPASNNYSTLTLGNPTGRRSYYALPPSGAPLWRYNDGDAGYTIYHPGKNGTIALEGHTHDDRYYTESEIDTKLNGKANTSHGNHVPSTCTTITDWNSATTNGWYMASNASNQPVSNGGWFYGIAIVHNSNYIRQIAWRFATDNSVAGTNCDRYERVKHNGTWGSWVNTSVRVAVPSGAKFTDTNTWRPLGTTADTACAGNDSRLSNARPASDVYAWAKASSKPSYAWSEITSKPSTFTPASHTHNYAGSSSAGGDATRAIAVADYGDTSKTIKIGYSGEGATTSNLTHIAGYLTGGTQIKDVSKDTLKSWLGLGSAAYTASSAYATSSHTHSNYLTSIPTASSTTLGGVKVGTNLTISSGVLSATQRSVSGSLTSTSTTTALSSAGGKSLQDQITTLKSNLSSLIIVESQSFTYNVAGTSTKTITGTITSKDGYIPIMIAPRTSGNEDVCWVQCFMNFNTKEISLQLRNTWSGSKGNITAQVYVMYLKNIS